MALAQKGQMILEQLFYYNNVQISYRQEKCQQQQVFPLKCVEKNKAFQLYALGQQQMK
jgi:hypothetical protein